MRKLSITLKTVVSISKGVLFLDAIVLVILAITGMISKTIIISLGFGSIYAILNLRLLSLALEKALKMPPSRAQIYASSQYFLRMALTGVVILLALKADYLNPIAVIAPMFFPKIVILGNNIIKAKFTNNVVE